MVNDNKPQDRAGDEPDRTLPAAPARTSGDVTLILSRIEQGEPQAAEQLLPLVYDELRKLAAAKMAQEKPEQTLQATALVHEAYIRLVDTEKVQHWNSRGHFFGAAAEAMRRILVENARRKNGPEAGGSLQRVEMSHVDPEIQTPGVDLIALHEALTRLEARDHRAAELVKLRFFAGLTREQAANVLGISVPTADTDWAYAKSWLLLELSDSGGDSAVS
jgi:RNA polymerase sigma factor (TIGR02999 family)